MSSMGRRLRTRPPGSLLRDRVLPTLGLSVSQAARDLQITRQTLHRILAGDAAITPDMATRLERFCGIHSRFWLGLQQDFELERISTQYRDLYDRIPLHPLPETFLMDLGAIHE